MTQVAPPATRQQFVASVHANLPLCREHFKLVLRVERFPQSDPGQFIQILCHDIDLPNSPNDELIDWRGIGWPTVRGHELTEPRAMLRRPFSLAGRRNLQTGEVELHIIARVVGVGTAWMSQLKPGDAVSVIGPLGNRFALPSARETAILVGGGVGIPPMIYLAQSLAGRAIAFCGATTRDLLPLTLSREAANTTRDPTQPSLAIEEFAIHNIPLIITTDDGTLGFRGFVTDALSRYLDSVASPLAPRRSPLILYTCGPEPMMKRVAQIALDRGIECQIAVERAMACGMGTCQSCCIRVRKPDPAIPPLPGRDWCYRLACTDGPIFRANELLW